MKDAMIGHQGRQFSRIGDGMLVAVGDEREMNAKAELRIARANSMARAVAGMAGIMVALVSPPRSKHSTVPRSVSSDMPKSSAVRTMRMYSLDR